MRGHNSAAARPRHSHGSRPLLDRGSGREGCGYGERTGEFAHTPFDPGIDLIERLPGPAPRIADGAPPDGAGVEVPEDQDLARGAVRDAGDSASLAGVHDNRQQGAVERDVAEKAGSMRGQVEAESAGSVERFVGRRSSGSDEPGGDHREVDVAGPSFASEGGLGEGAAANVAVADEQHRCAGRKATEVAQCRCSSYGMERAIDEVERGTRRATEHAHRPGLTI